MKFGQNLAPARIAIFGLWFSWVSPLVQTFLGTPDLTGLELAFYFFALTISLIHSDNKESSNLKFGFFFPFVFLCIISTIYNQIDFRSALLFLSMNSILPTLLFLMLILNRSGKLLILRHTLCIGVLQISISIHQILTHPLGTVDHVQGTLLGTGAGGHIAPFASLLTCSYFSLKYMNFLIIRYFAILLGLAICYFGDAKQVILAFFTVIALNFIFTQNKSKYFFPRILAAITVFISISLYLNGTFGGINSKSYIDLSLSTGGGKVSVAEQIILPNSEFHKKANYFIGSGPSQTVGRSALLTVANSFSPVAPASKFGIPPAKYYNYFSGVAKGRGYVGDSSFTSPTSSLLGIFGDIGLFGFVAYLYVLIKLIYQCRTKEMFINSLTLISLCTVFFILSFFGEWLENPPAIAFCLIIFTSKLFNSRWIQK